MINNDTSNIKFTDEQTRQLEEFKTRLSNIETEISIASKNLGVIKKEIEKSTKEKIYQEELLNKLIPQVEDEKSILDNLDKDIKGKVEMLNELLSQYKEHTDLMAKGKTDHDERESKIVSRETELSNQGSALGKEKVLLENDKATFNQKVSKLQEVISQF